MRRNEALPLVIVATLVSGLACRAVPPLETKPAAEQTGHARMIELLRDGEVKNCALRHNAESCILPIRGQGIHTDTSGSLAAIRAFEEVLSRTSRSSPLNLEAVWLANIAYMTLGAYPEGVPEAWRIPAEVFDSAGPFPRFQNVAPELGVDTWSLSGGVVFDDLDGDSDLDLFTTTLDTASEPRFFRNNGDGTFVDASREAGLAGIYGGLNVVQADYDNDGDLDLYVLRGGWFYTAGRHPNSLLANDGHGAFTDVTFEAGLGEVHYPTQTAAWADYDGDGDLDLWVSSYRGYGSLALVAASYFGQPVPWELERLYRGDGRGGFTDVSARVGLDRLHLTMGSNYGDFDADGFPDVYLGTGYPDYEAVMPNVLYHNRGGTRFDDVTLSAGLGHLQKGHAVAFGDFDGDGDLDVFEQMGGAYPGDRFGDALYRNPGFGNHWLAVRLVGRRSNRFGVGARIRVDVVEGSRRRSVFAWMSSGGSFGGNPLRQTIGLGKASRIERMEIDWPTVGPSQVLTQVPMDRVIVVTEGASGSFAAGQSAAANR